jgi:hypothetical protein
MSSGQRLYSSLPGSSSQERLADGAPLQSPYIKPMYLASSPSEVPQYGGDEHQTARRRDEVSSNGRKKLAPESGNIIPGAVRNSGV